MKKICISDVTLKAVDEQEFSLTFREKLAIAEKLDSLLVDYIELPPQTNSKETEIIYRNISSSLKNATVKIPVGDSEQSLEFAVKCVKKAKRVCLQVVLPVSTALMEYIYHVKAPVMLEKIANLVSLAKAKYDLVEFVALDAFRAEDGFVEECAKIAFENGASIITICDNEGVALLEDYTNLIKKIKDVCDISVHVQPSNNLSMASACVIQAIKAGADGVNAAVSGNYLDLAIFAEIVRAKKFDLDIETKLDITNTKTVSADVCDVLKGQAQAVEQTVNMGFVDNNCTIKDIAEIVKQLGYEISDSDIGKVFEEFKKITAKKERIDTKELEALVASVAMQVPSTYHLINYVVNSGNIIPATANVTLEKDGEKFTGVSTGDGPIDAAFHAIEQVIGHHYELDDFQVHAVTKGRGAVGSSIIRLRANGKLYPGNGVSTDIVGACIRAYINALNKIVYEEK